jgi:hypothetical protein
MHEKFGRRKKLKLDSVEQDDYALRHVAIAIRARAYVQHENADVKLQDIGKGVKAVIPTLESRG